MEKAGPDGEWYCVMNKWDEKIASCASPLVMQDAARRHKIRTMDSWIFEHVRIRDATIFVVGKSNSE
jgi:hypothetical protein